MTFTTADLCDQYAHSEHFQIAEPIFKSFGANPAFCGQITTLKVFEDNILVRETLSQKVNNRVLVIDGGGSHRCALLGSDLAQMAYDNGWQGIVVYGCIRDTVQISRIPLGIRALHAHPLKSRKRGGGNKNVLISFAGINFKKDHFLFTDEDGMIVSETQLR